MAKSDKHQALLGQPTDAAELLLLLKALES